MARPVPALSDGFLAAHRGRLDALGQWEVESLRGRGGEGNELWMHWPDPPALAGVGIPFDLWFHLVSAPGRYPGPRFDPDDRMFGLLAAFLARRDELVGQLRELAERARVAGRPPGRPRWELCVVRIAEPGREPGYELSVNFCDADDPESIPGWACYDEARGRFGPVEG